jgi:hypothetical protein
MPARKKSRAKPEGDALTNLPETPALDGGVPLPDELTGRASKTSDDLGSLFDNESSEHIQDGFRGGSGDDPESLDPTLDEEEEPAQSE